MNKKSKNNIIVGGIILSIILLVAALGAGVYYYDNTFVEDTFTDANTETAVEELEINEITETNTSVSDSTKTIVRVGDMGTFELNPSTEGIIAIKDTCPSISKTTTVDNNEIQFENNYYLAVVEAGTYTVSSIPTSSDYESFSQSVTVNAGKINSDSSVVMLTCYEIPSYTTETADEPDAEDATEESTNEENIVPVADDDDTSSTTDDSSSSTSTPSMPSGYVCVAAKAITNTQMTENGYDAVLQDVLITLQPEEAGTLWDEETKSFLGGSVAIRTGSDGKTEYGRYYVPANSQVTFTPWTNNVATGIERTVTASQNMVWNVYYAPKYVKSSFDVKHYEGTLTMNLYTVHDETWINTGIDSSGLWQMAELIQSSLLKYTYDDTSAKVYYSSDGQDWTYLTHVDASGASSGEVVDSITVPATVSDGYVWIGFEYDEAQNGAWDTRKYKITTSSYGTVSLSFVE